MREKEREGERPSIFFCSGFIFQLFLVFNVWGGTPAVGESTRAESEGWADMVQGGLGLSSGEVQGEIAGEILKQRQGGLGAGRRGTGQTWSSEKTMVLLSSNWQDISVLPLRGLSSSEKIHHASLRVKLAA